MTIDVTLQIAGELALAVLTLRLWRLLPFFPAMPKCYYAVERGGPVAAVTLLEGARGPSSGLYPTSIQSSSSYLLELPE